MRGDDREVLEEIRQRLDEIKLGFDVKVLNVLESETARPPEVEALKDRLGELVAARLFSVANSTYYGKVRSGKITRFVDVVKHLGVDTTRSTAIFVGLMALTDSPRIREVFARNFSTGKLAEFLAVKLGRTASDRSTAALSGLFSEMGKVVMLLYQDKFQAQLSPDFVERYYPEVGAMVIERFELPPVLAKVINHTHFSFTGRDDLSLSAIVDLAHAITDRSFARHGKLVVESAMPDPEGILYTRTMGSLFAGQFQSIGLSGYLQVIPSQLTAREQYLFEKRKRETDPS